MADFQNYKKLNDKVDQISGGSRGGRIKLPPMNNAIIFNNIRLKKNLKKIDNFFFYS